MADQLAFDLPANVRLGADDFFVSAANEQAFALVTSPESWPDGKLALIGPEGSGKSHLAQVFVQQSGAILVSAAALRPDAPLPDRPLVIEDADKLPEPCEEWVFHAHNHLRAERIPLLVTATTPPARWDIALPDLASRLSAATTATIRNPDDALLMAVLLKQLQDRQLTPAPDAVTYLQRHLPRSFAAVRDAVATLDRAALEQGKALTRPFVQRVLDSDPPDRQ